MHSMSLCGIKKVLGIFGPLENLFQQEEEREQLEWTTKVHFWDPPSRSKNVE